MASSPTPPSGSGLYLDGNVIRDARLPGPRPRAGTLHGNGSSDLESSLGQDYHIETDTWSQRSYNPLSNHKWSSNIANARLPF